MRYLATIALLFCSATSAFAAGGCPSTVPGPGYANGQFVRCAVLTAGDMNAFSADLLGLIQQVQAQIPGPGLSTSANQTNGNQKSQIVDGSGNVIGSISGSIFSNLRNAAGAEVGTSGNPLQIASNPKAFSPQALTSTTITSAGTSYVALTSGQHAQGGWIRNCNASGIMYVNDSGVATQTESGANYALAPGTGGTGGVGIIYAGTTTISVTGSVNGMTICGEGYN